MSKRIELTLPQMNVSPASVTTPFGRMIVPGRSLPAKKIEIDAELIAELLRTARQAAAMAYAPYSNFHVGTAIIMADDPEQRIRAGANVENSSYGATSCAERSALHHCAALGFRRLKYLAVSTASALDRPLSERSPCGICRQVIGEFCPGEGLLDDALILIDNGDPDTLCEVLDIDRLLPYGFSLNP